VQKARAQKIHVEACSGPSSIFFALMLSGLPAQRFSFQGYLEREADILKRQIQELEKQSRDKRITQVFIEAPYRCQNLFQSLLDSLDEKTLLSICMNLTAPDEWVETQPVREWKRRPCPDLHKKLVVFLFSANGFK
jgi:16S rRNA (cytidine1402-2'-O)-methyltransferase